MVTLLRRHRARAPRLGARRPPDRLLGALRLLAAAVLLAGLTGTATAQQIDARPLADGCRPGHWTPVRVSLSTGDAPFEGDVVLRLESAQVHRVPLRLPAHAERAVVVGVLPFRPFQRVEVEAGDPRASFDLRPAADSILGAEASVLAEARRERGDGVVALGEEDSALWEGFDEVCLSREEASRRWGLTIEADRAWLRPVDRPWGVEWSEAGGERREAVPSVQGVWASHVRSSTWGPAARRLFLVTLAAFAGALLIAHLASRQRRGIVRAAAIGVVSGSSVLAACLLPPPGVAVSATVIVGPSSGGWRARGFGCASRGSEGDVVLDLPGVPRPVFRDLAEAQEASWGIVWGERRRLVFPSRRAGSGCWFEWQARAPIQGKVLALRDGSAANETTERLSPALLLVDGQARSVEALPAGQTLSPGPGAALPRTITASLLTSLDASWRRGRLLLGRASIVPPGLSGVDLVEGETWLWVPLD